MVKIFNLSLSDFAFVCFKILMTYIYGRTQTVRFFNFRAGMIFFEEGNMRNASGNKIVQLWSHFLNILPTTSSFLIVTSSVLIVTLKRGFC